MFSKSAQYYDEVYASIDKDYSSEADKAHKIIQEYEQSKGKLLLDVALSANHDPNGLDGRELYIGQKSI